MIALLVLTAVSCTEVANIDRQRTWMGAIDMDTYKGELQLLCWVCVLHDELTECLPDTMTAALFGHLVELIVGDIEPIFGLVVCPQTFLRPYDLLSCW